VDGLLQILPSGPLPPDTTEFLGKRAVAEVVAELRDRADLVLLDTTPLLAVGDAIALTALVDGVIVVVRGKQARRNAMREAARVLGTAPAASLGFVVTGAELSDEYYGGYHYYDVSPSRAAKEPVA
jgi:non-specific protein-tyrosine kinase